MSNIVSFKIVTRCTCAFPDGKANNGEYQDADETTGSNASGHNNQVLLMANTYAY